MYYAYFFEKFPILLKLIPPPHHRSYVCLRRAPTFRVSFVKLVKVIILRKYQQNVGYKKNLKIILNLDGKWCFRNVYSFTYKFVLKKTLKVSKTGLNTLEVSWIGLNTLEVSWISLNTLEVSWIGLNTLEVSWIGLNTLEVSWIGFFSCP